MRLTRIAARDFLGYADVDLDLSLVTSAVVVGMNGHGKSSLIDVVTYALYGKGRFRGAREGGSPDQQVRDGADAMWTCVEFDAADGRHVRVERSKNRGKTASIHVWVGDDDTLSSGWTNAETDDFIERLVGVPYDTLMAGPFMAQKQSGLLMGMQAADRLRMLVSLFDAEWCAPLHDEAKRQRDVAEQSRVAAQARVDELTALIADRAEVETGVAQGTSALAALNERQSLAATELADLRVKVAKAEAAAARAADIKHQLDAAVARMAADDAEQVRLAGIIAQAETFLAQPVPMMPDFDAGPSPEDIAAAQALVTAGVDARVRASALAAEVAGVERALLRDRDQRSILATVPCGGVGKYAACRFLTDVPTEDALAHAESHLAALRDDEAKVGTSAAELASAPERLAELRERAESISRERAAARATIERWNDKRAAAAAAKDQHTATLSAIHDRVAAEGAARERLLAEAAALRPELVVLAEAEAERGRIEGVVAQVREQTALVEPRLAALNARLAVIRKAEEDVAGWRAQVLGAASNAETFGVLAKAFHVTGIPTLIIENGLAAIEEHANDLLGRLPQDFRIEMRTQRDTKAGGKMDTLDIIVTTNGYERDYAMLSWGQRLRVDLALRIALTSVLAGRRGAMVDTLVLDEPLADLDAEGREAAVEALNVLAADFGLILVVSHHPEFNDKFGASIEVEQEAGISSARLVA